MQSYLTDVRTLFAFALKRKYIRDNPALAVDSPRVEEKPPGIVTPVQARAILDASIDHAPDILPVLVLTMFGGLRRSEAEQLEWAEISDKFVEVKAHKAKTRQRRLIEISPQLRAWLNCSRARHSRANSRRGSRARARCLLGTATTDEKNHAGRFGRSTRVRRTKYDARGSGRRASSFRLRKDGGLQGNFSRWPICRIHRTRAGWFDRMERVTCHVALQL